MSVQFSTTLRNAFLDTWESTIGTSAIIQIRSGPPPVNCAASDTGTLIVEFTLGSDWAAVASGGSKSLSSLPITENGLALATAGHYRVKNSAGTVCHEQGIVSSPGGGGDMILSDTSIDVGQPISIISWTKVAPGA